MDEIAGIGRLPRVERAADKRERDARERQEKRGPQTAGRRSQEGGATAPEGPYEGDDGHLHVDIRA